MEAHCTALVNGFKSSLALLILTLSGHVASPIAPAKLIKWASAAQKGSTWNEAGWRDKQYISDQWVAHYSNILRFDVLYFVFFLCGLYGAWTLLIHNRIMYAGSTDVNMKIKVGVMRLFCSRNDTVSHQSTLSMRKSSMFFFFSSGAGCFGLWVITTKVWTTSSDANHHRIGSLMTIQRYVSSCDGHLYHMFGTRN